MSYLRGKSIKKLKIKLLLLQYEIELKQGNYAHLKDYIAYNVILSLLKDDSLENIDSKYDFNEITLNKLVNWLFSEKAKGSCNYEVPSINVLNYIIKKKEKELKKSLIKCGINEEITAAIWLKFMLEKGLIQSQKIIDLNEYKLKDFITDSRLIKITGISELSTIDLHDFILEKPKQKVKINKSK